MTTTTKSVNKLGDKRGLNQNSLKNLKPYPKGVNGQIASGHTPGYSLTSRLKDALDKPLEAPAEDASVKDLIVHSTIQGAILREPTPFKEVWDRTEGKVTDTHAIIGGIILRIVDDDDSNQGTDNPPAEC